MTKGYNKADALDKLYWKLESKEVQTRTCVFLSHKSQDKPECKKIAEYLRNAGLDYYLDELDINLQRAAIANNPMLITESIKKGIRESTHMLVIVSEKTYQSQWVSFEVGYGHAAILDNNSNESLTEDKIRLSILTLKNIAEVTLPDFMQVGNIIRGTKGLNEYIAVVSGKEEKSLVTENRLISNNSSGHPLDNILNWKL